MQHGRAAAKRTESLFNASDTTSLEVVLARLSEDRNLAELVRRLMGMEELLRAVDERVEALAATLESLKAELDKRHVKGPDEGDRDGRGGTSRGGGSGGGGEGASGLMA